MRERHFTIPRERMFPFRSEATFAIEQSGGFGRYTKRPRCRVYCFRCLCEVHPATVAPELWARSHHDHHHLGAANGLANGLPPVGRLTADASSGVDEDTEEDDWS
jgi:hypothetical protein